MTKTQLIAELTSVVLTGGRRTTAVNVRQLITDLINSYQDNTSSAQEITAFATGGQANATPLTNKNNRIDTAASSGASVLLLPAIKDLEQLVQNNAGNDINVYPTSGDKFLNLAIDAPFGVVVGNQLKVYCFKTGEWTLI